MSSVRSRRTIACSALYYIHCCHSQVKEKMLYAATKATIRKAFSSGVIIDDIAATHKVRVELHVASL